MKNFMKEFLNPNGVLPSASLNFEQNLVYYEIQALMQWFREICEQLTGKDSAHFQANISIIHLNIISDIHVSFQHRLNFTVRHVQTSFFHEIS